MRGAYRMQRTDVQSAQKAGYRYRASHISQLKCNSSLDGGVRCLLHQPADKDDLKFYPSNLQEDGGLR